MSQDSEISKRLVRLYERDEDGRLYDRKEDLDVATELAGAIPRVGEFIVERWLRASREPANHRSNRSVLVVEAVYYRPDKISGRDDEHSWVVLVVRPRCMTDEEGALL